MYCSKCGKEVASEERFCNACGFHKKQETPPFSPGEWYYANSVTGERLIRIRGPFYESSMRKMLRNGTLNGNTNIRRGENGLWSKASDTLLFQDVVKTPKTSLKISPKQIRLYLFIAGGVLLCILLINMKLPLQPVTSVPTSPEKYAFNPPTLFHESYPNRRLPNGTILSSSELNGRSLLTVRNGLSLDAVAKLIDVRDNICKAYFYVSSGNEFKLEGIQPGAYRLKFCVGEDWDDSRQHFSRNQGFSEFDRPLFFVENEVKNGNQTYYNYTTMVTTLNPVLNGNAPTHSISETDFK